MVLLKLMLKEGSEHVARGRRTEMRPPPFTVWRLRGIRRSTFVEMAASWIIRYRDYLREEGITSPEGI
jgi:hypothetical protein